MEMATAYQQDRYDIVEQVCSQSRRKGRCASDQMPSKRRKESSPGSHYFELAEHPDNLGSASTRKSVAHHEHSTPESTTTYAQVPSRQSLEDDKLSPGEEVLRLKNGNDGSVLQATQLQQHGHVCHEFFQEPQTLESANLLQRTFPANNGVQLKESLQDDLWDLVDDMPFETLDEIEQPDTELELTWPFHWGLESVELEAQPKETLQGHARDDSLETENTTSAPNEKKRRMEKQEKRVRGSNWNHEHTMALAELKREISPNYEDGRLVWERIAHTLSRRIPDFFRTGAQCRRRWDTLVKVYNHIEDYCVQTGVQGHRELDEGELTSMELATAYHKDWYEIVEQVCSRRKMKDDERKMMRERCNGVRPAKPFPWADCSMKICVSVTPHEQSTPESTTTSAQVPSSPSLEVDKLSPGEEVSRLKNGNDSSVLPATQLRQHERVSRRSRTWGSNNIIIDPRHRLLPGHLWASGYAVPVEASVEMEQFEKELFSCELESVGGRVPSKGPLQTDVSDDSSMTAIAQGGGMIDGDDLMGIISGAMDSTIQPRIKTMDYYCDDREPKIRRRWSLKVILLKVRQCCHACRRKERTDDMELESKQAVRLEEKTRKKALMSRKENVPAVMNAASPTSATSAARGDKSSQKDAHRASKQAAADKKGEETRSRKAVRQQLGGKSSSTCVPIGKLCTRLSKKFFPALHGRSSK